MLRKSIHTKKAIGASSPAMLEKKQKKYYQRLKDYGYK
jgi:hypothetical protein